MVLVLVLLLTQAAQQAPPRDAKPTASSGTAVIAGRVVDAETGAPIGGATLQIGPIKIGERPTQVEAGPRGEFRLTGLAAGDYMIVASPPEFRATHLPQIYNADFAQLMSGGRPVSVQLADGQKREDLVIRLPRALAVDGMVVDELGEPMANIRVTPEVVQLAGASIPTGMWREEPTDDRGAFRLFGLAPGIYRMCAMPGPDFQTGSLTGGNVLERRYVKTCYPSSPAGGGERVTISGNATPVLTIVMQHSAGYTIAGRATSESGTKYLRVAIQRIGDTGSSNLPVEKQEDGRFVARGATPGKYRVSAYAGEGAALFESSAPEQAKAIVEVGASDVTGIELVTTKGASLAGRIVPAEPLPAGTKLRVAQSVGLAAMAEGGSSSFKPAPVREDLSFELADIRGEVLFDVSGLPDRWVVTSMRYRGADVTDTSVAVTTSTDPRDFEIHVSPRSGQIMARPLDAEGRSRVRRVRSGVSSERGSSLLPAGHGRRQRSGTECTILDTFVLENIVWWRSWRPT